MKATLETTLGKVVIELDEAKAPITVKNFVGYVKSGHYEGTIFHRVIPGFMAQGGGMTEQLEEKDTLKPIKNEAANGLKNLRGTIAMARTSVVDSATSQFFINLVDNGFLDYAGPTPRKFGYCVFGKVVQGMDIVDCMAKIPTMSVGPYDDVPRTAIKILKATVEEAEEKPAATNATAKASAKAKAPAKK